MVDAEPSRKEPVKEQKTSMEHIPSKSDAPDEPRSESAILEESATASPPPIISFIAPNGGWKAWSAVLGDFLCQFASFGFLNVLGVFQTRYEEFNLSNYNSSDISWIFTFQLFLMFLFAQVDGMLVDMFGPRAVMIPSAILELLGLAMVSLCQCQSYYQFFLAQGVCFGIGSAGLFMPGLIIAGQYFTTRRGFAVDIVASGASMGGVIFPFALNRMFKSVGFDATIRYTLFIGDFGPQATIV